MYQALRGLIRAIRAEPGYLWLLATMATLIGTGTAFYSVHENWSVIDALFFSVTTLTTTGYGNLVPETELGKVFTMLYVLLGAGIIVAFFNLVITGLRMGRERPERCEQSDRTAQG